MREILFRGKRIDNGEWVEGYYICLNGAETLHIIVDEHGQYHRVDHESISEFCGLTDKNGKKIFEGDIISMRIGRAHIVNFENGAFSLTDTAIPIRYADKFEIIGNIHDNRLEDFENGR